MERQSTNPAERAPIDGLALNEPGARALAIWEEIRSRNQDPYEEIREEEYREFAERVGEFTGARRFLETAIVWTKSEDDVKRRYGQMLVLAHSLTPIFEGIDKLRENYSDIDLHVEDLIETRLAYAYKSLRRSTSYRNYPQILISVKRRTFEDGEKMILGNEIYQELVDLKKAQRQEARASREAEIVLGVESVPSVIQERQKWNSWLQVARYGGVAAVIVLGLIGSKLASAAVENELKVGLQGGSSPGVSVEWIEFGPIDLTKSEYLGDMIPLVPSQVKTRKFTKVGLGGVESGKSEEKRQAVVRKYSNGEIVGLGDYQNAIGARVVLDGNNYVVKFRDGSPEEVAIWCWDKERILKKEFKGVAPVDQVKESDCVQLHPKFQVADWGPKRERVIGSGGLMQIKRS